MSQDDGIKEKQEYLRKHILEKGYNADEFMEYLKKIKGEKALLLENWTQDDLSKAVEEFIKLNIKDHNKLNDYNNEEKEKPQPAEDIQEFVKCKTNEITEISIKNELNITVSNPEVVDEGLFSKSYVTYCIKTQPLEFEVHRSYPDFKWLRTKLASLYKNCVVPPLFKEKYFMSNEEISKPKRMRALEMFLKELTIHPLLKNSELLFNFIATKDNKQFKLFNEKIDKIQIPTQIKELKTLNGELNISITKEKSEKVDIIKNEIETKENLFKKLTKDYKLLNYSITESIRLMKIIQTDWLNLYDEKIIPLIITTSPGYIIPCLNLWKIGPICKRTILI